MPVPSRSRFLPLAVAAFLFVFGYYGVLVAEIRPLRASSKEIVAYSLLKKIEIQNEEINCQEKKIEDLGEAQPWTRIPGTNLHVFSVHEDRRLNPFRFLRIIGMVRGELPRSIFCQTLSPEGKLKITKASFTEIWSKNWGGSNDSSVYYHPYLISCALKQPSSYLLLSDNPCSFRGEKFRINPPTPGNKTFTICVKPLNFHEDISERLLQWLTINQILGAENFEIYFEKIPRNLQQILGKLKNVVLKEFVKLEGEDNVWQKRRYELVVYNDCFYRNIHASHFVVPVDIDEIIVPRHASTWAKLLGEDNFASYTVRNAYYLRQFAAGSKERIFFFRDFVRSFFSEEGESGKSFVSTKNALTVFNHYALEALRPGVGMNKFLSSEDVQMNHYKDKCDVELLPQCDKYLTSPVRIVDRIIFKFQKRFYEQYRKMLSVMIT